MFLLMIEAGYEHSVVNIFAFELVASIMFLTEIIPKFFFELPSRKTLILI